MAKKDILSTTTSGGDKQLYFVFGKEDFMVRLSCKKENKKIVFSPESVQFIDYFNTLGLGTIDIRTLDKINHFAFPENRTASLKLRKKAIKLNLPVEPGNFFKGRKEADLMKKHQKQAEIASSNK